MKVFYTYVHIRNDSNQPFYVGKGQKDRAYSKKNRNKHWHSIAESVGYRVEIVVSSIDEELAFLCEIELISKYRSMGYALANYTDGGEGPAGYKHTDASKMKMRRPRINGSWRNQLTDSHKANLSKSKKGKPAPQLGAVLTEEHKRKLSESHKGIMTSYCWWNDGMINTRSKESPGEGWVKGRHKK